MSKIYMGFYSGFFSHMNTRFIDNFIDANDLLLKSGLNQQVRLGRLFLSDSAGNLSNQANAEYVVVCDFDGVPMFGPSGPFTFKIRLRKAESVGSTALLLEKNVILFGSKTEISAAGDFFALDHPETSDIDFIPVNGASARLAEYYKCKVGSTRATVAFDSTGMASFVGIVGSRYTVLQNEEIARDAQAFTTSSGQHFGSCAPHVITYGTPSHFGVAMDMLYSEPIIESEINGRQGLLLLHSHDTSFAYNHIWTIQGTVPGAQFPTVLGIHKVKIKHTKNIGDRAELIAQTIAEIQEQYKLFLDDMYLFKSVAIYGFNDLDEYLELINKNSKKKIEEWLIKKYRKKYLGEVAPVLGFNLWSLFLAVADIDGSYWDGRMTETLPSLLDAPAAMRTRINSRNNWRRFVIEVLKPQQLE